jgi:carbon storage regulator
MLNLSRKVGEQIVIGDDVVVTYLGTNRKGEARIGIEAPRSLPVHREEVYLSMQQRGDYRSLAGGDGEE